MRKFSDEVIIMTDDGSYGEHGNVCVPLDRILASGKKVDKIFAIGPLIMMKFVVETAKKEIAEKAAALPFANLNISRFKGENMNELFESKKWKKLSAACLGCGSCTFVCPTCQCYDIRDYNTGHGIERYRCWDSCMYHDFTLMAAETPRPTQVERYRQRFMHKLVYFPANNDGMYSCVGCGRCVEKCPMNLNIVKVIKALGEEE